MQNQLLQDIMCANFQAKPTTFTFQTKFAQKRILGSEFRSSKPGFGISTSIIPWVPISRQNGQLWIFGPNLPKKWILGSEFRNSKPGFGISSSIIPRVPIFRQNGQLWIFGVNLGKLPNYVRYFSYYNVEGVAESWVEA